MSDCKNAKLIGIDIGSTKCAVSLACSNGKGVTWRMEINIIQKFSLIVSLTGVRKGGKWQ